MLHYKCYNYTTNELIGEFDSAMPMWPDRELLLDGIKYIIRNIVHVPQDSDTTYLYLTDKTI